MVYESHYDRLTSVILGLEAGRLPKNNGIPWRNNSGLQDGSFFKDVKQGLIGGYYDAGANIKFHFPMAFSMTMLSWTVIEYSHKYKGIGEYNHIRELIKWGTDYLLLTFNSTASTIDHVYSQVLSISTFFCCTILLHVMLITSFHIRVVLTSCYNILV